MHVRVLRLLLPLWCFGPAGGGAAQEPPVLFRLGAAVTEVRPGGTMVLTIGARIPVGWHLYGLRQPAGGPLPTVLKVTPEPSFGLASPVTSTPARAEFDPNFGMLVEWHADSAAFRLPLRASPTALPGTYDVQVRISYQRCNDRMCLPLATDTMRVPIVVAGSPVTPMQATSGPGVPVPSTSPPGARRGGDSAPQRDSLDRRAAGPLPPAAAAARSRGANGESGGSGATGANGATGASGASGANGYLLAAAVAVVLAALLLAARRGRAAPRR